MASFWENFGGRFAANPADIFGRLGQMGQGAALADAVPMAGPAIQQVGAPVPVQDQVATTAAPPATVPANAGGDPQAPRPNFGSYIPPGLVRMLMMMQQRNPDMFATALQRPSVQRYGLTPETDLANLYNRRMARQDWRGGTDPLAAGTVLTPEQRAQYGGGWGGGGGRMMGMAERPDKLQQQPAAQGTNSGGY